MAAKHHHEDEEQDIFPRLVRQSSKLTDLIRALKREHTQLVSLWDEITPYLATPASIKDVEGFRPLATRFAEAYRTHVRKENNELLEMAQHIFSNDELKQIGGAMAERRGIKQPI